MANRSGTPVIVSPAANGRPFQRVREISTRKDDPASFAEDLTQCLVADCPDILPVREFFPSVSTIYSLAREVPVHLGDTGGFIDNLLVTDDGHLVVVETKLFRNREAIREVVAQTLQYGMAISSMRVEELQAAIRSGVSPVLGPGEGIVDAVQRVALQVDGPGALAEDFEESFERQLRRGEILLLVVTDGVRVGVERVVQWLEAQSSSAPYRFGIVELKFYDCGDHRLVVPRTTIATREISRHVVVVDVHPQAGIEVSAAVIDEARAASGAKIGSARQVKVDRPPITKEAYLQERPPEARAVIAGIIDALEARGLEMNNAPRTLRYGFTTEDGEFHPLVLIDWAGLWGNILKRDRDVLEDEDILAFKKGCNAFARFYKDESLEKPDGSGGVAAKFEDVARNAAEFADFLLKFRDKIADAWERR